MSFRLYLEMVKWPGVVSQVYNPNVGGRQKSKIKASLRPGWSTYATQAILGYTAEPVSSKQIKAHFM